MRRLSNYVVLLSLSSALTTRRPITASAAAQPEVVRGITARVTTPASRQLIDVTVSLVRAPRRTAEAQSSVGGRCALALERSLREVVGEEFEGAAAPLLLAIAAAHQKVRRKGVGCVLKRGLLGTPTPSHRHFELPCRCIVPRAPLTIPAPPVTRPFSTAGRAAPARPLRELPPLPLRAQLRGCHRRPLPIGRGAAIHRASIHRPEVHNLLLSFCE